MILWEIVSSVKKPSHTIYVIRIIRCIEIDKANIAQTLLALLSCDFCLSGSNGWANYDRNENGNLVYKYFSHCLIVIGVILWFSIWEVDMSLALPPLAPSSPSPPSHIYKRYTRQNESYWVFVSVGLTEHPSFSLTVVIVSCVRNERARIISIRSEMAIVLFGLVCLGLVCVCVCVIV